MHLSVGRCSLTRKLNANAGVAMVSNLFYGAGE